MRIGRTQLNLISASALSMVQKSEVAKVLFLNTLLPIFDMGTDFYTSINLYVDGNPIWGTLILLFMWTPSILFFLNQRVRKFKNTV